MLRLTLRIDQGSVHLLGPGKVRLLELIAEQGSIAAAAREMGMSYRRAWLLVEALKQSFATPMVEAHPGGAGGGGARLTEAAKRLVAHYRAIEAAAIESTKATLASLEAMLPG